MVPIKKIPTENLEQIEWPAEEEGELAIDLYETENELVLKSAIGGVKAENLDISITNDMITITGERQLEEKEEIKKIYYQECFWGRFSRAVILPKEVKSDSATAVIKNGILTIRLPKAEDNKKQGIKIIEEE
ncbi:MAG TPA: Hsp20/alpha crystallin family protein [Candidatus Paceibacterota bacterium]|nr:Hsp20/alpha crystallin family protein [Candidatus Paceibacterota bacterium]HPC30740.1 Hsp20/alpha crystallin family protein [Candidatus Pacearchaeota archaeon]